MPFFHQGLLRVAVASPRVTVADPAANVRAIADLLRKAEARDVSLVVFPELCVTGYTCGDLFGQLTLLEAALRPSPACGNCSRSPRPSTAGWPWWGYP
jgi:predicted amidohydrolase